jgi:hypothetical protein
MTTFAVVSSSSTKKHQRTVVSSGRAVLTYLAFIRAVVRGTACHSCSTLTQAELIDVTAPLLLSVQPVVLLLHVLVHDCYYYCYWQ